MIQLGTVTGHGPLAYDATLYEFRISNAVTPFKEVQALDAHGHIAWLAPEQHDWFVHINAHDLETCNHRALQRHGNGYNSLTPEEQVQADAARDDSVLAGKIVEADPELVRAVADALEQKGLIGHVSHAHAGNAQTVIGMPQGMEALSQLQKQEGRKMTLMEHYLMRQILKNDDKAKVKREKEAEALQAAELKEEQREAKNLKKKGKISSAQKHMEKREAQTEAGMRQRSAAMQVEKAAPQRTSGGMTIDQALAMAETGASARLHVTADAMTAAAAQNVVYTDSYGNLIRPEADAIRPDVSQVAYGVSAEEKALTEMRARNLAEQSRYDVQSTGVPGMEMGRSRGPRAGINEGASINGHAVNADGTPKENGFTSFVGGLKKVSEALSPLVGGGHGGGMGGMGGGQGGGGQGGGGMGGQGGGMGGMGGGMR